MKTSDVGMDVHKATIVIAVLDVFDKLVSQSIIETSTRAMRDFFHAVRGELHVTCEGGHPRCCPTEWQTSPILPSHYHAAQ